MKSRSLRATAWISILFQATRIWRPSSAPKGRNRKAQGNALGKRFGINAEALKGRNPGSAGPRSRPFRATDLVMTSLPRALPWALVGRPFGAEADCGQRPCFGMCIRSLFPLRTKPASMRPSVFHPPTLGVNKPVGFRILAPPRGSNHLCNRLSASASDLSWEPPSAPRRGARCGRHGPPGDFGQEAGVFLAIVVGRGGKP